jgi:Uma2 family endonuclease
MVQVTAKVGMPLEEFIRLNAEHPFELINGERKPKLPTIFGHSEVIRILFIALYIHVVERELGEVYSETTFILPESLRANWVEGSRTPDLMFYTGKRVAVYKTENPDHRQFPLALIPDFVVEVVSPSDKYSELDEKVDAYLADGVRLIWVLDPQRHKATVHMPDAEQPTHLAGDAPLDGGDVIPDFRITLSKLFE